MDASFRLLGDRITEAMERLHVPGVAVSRIRARQA